MPKRKGEIVEYSNTIVNCTLIDRSHLTYEMWIVNMMPEAVTQRRVFMLTLCMREILTSANFEFYIFV